MPKRRKRAFLNRRTPGTARMRNIRPQKTEKLIRQDNANARVSIAQFRQAVSEDARTERNEQTRFERRQTRCFIVHKLRASIRQFRQVHGSFICDSFLRLTFYYEPDLPYY